MNTMENDPVASFMCTVINYSYCIGIKKSQILANDKRAGKIHVRFRGHAKCGGALCPPNLFFIWPSLFFGKIRDYL